MFFSRRFFIFKFLSLLSFFSWLFFKGEAFFDPYY